MSRLRAKGHALTVEWSGETGEERSSTGYCRCGWSESASTQDEVRFEYRAHLRKVLGLAQRGVIHHSENRLEP